MAGSYCNYCGHRCFVLRVLPDGPEKGWRGHMATCQGGMAHDLKETGHTHITAINPVTEDAAAILAGADSREGDVAECGYCTTRITLLGGHWTDDDGTTACTDTSAPYVPHAPKEAASERA